MIRRIIHEIRFRLDKEYRFDVIRKENFARIMAANNSIMQGKK